MALIQIKRSGFGTHSIKNPIKALWVLNIGYGLHRTGQHRADSAVKTLSPVIFPDLSIVASAWKLQAAIKITETKTTILSCIRTILTLLEEHISAILKLFES